MKIETRLGVPIVCYPYHGMYCFLGWLTVLNVRKLAGNTECKKVDNIHSTLAV